MALSGQKPLPVRHSDYFASIKLPIHQARADQADTNNFVMAHAMLDTLNASDQYAGARNPPAHLTGKAEPHRTAPRFTPLGSRVNGRPDTYISAAEALIPERFGQART